MEIAEPSLSPIVQHIVTVVEKRIRSGEYVQGHWLPSERDLTDEFGVNRVNVRAAIVELERRNLVLRSPRCRTVVRNFTSSPRPRFTDRTSIGLWIWPNPADPAAALVVKGIQQSIGDAYRLVIGNTAEMDWAAVRHSEAHFLEQIALDQDIAGLLIWYLGGEENRSMLQAVRDAGIPIVLMDRLPPTGFESDYVGVDNLHAAEQIVNHLLSLGHRSIAHITNTDKISTVEERFTGYRRALEKAGIAYRPELVTHPNDFAFTNAANPYDALLSLLLTLPEPPTAIFAVNEWLALHLLTVIRKRGLRVPEDIAIAGFDGLEQWMLGSEPFLTTAAQPFQRIGERAADLLLRRLREEPSSSYRHLVLEAQISIRNSTLSDS